jgi:methylmalonyl-CoA mutase N-terminal domain/subunit
LKSLRSRRSQQEVERTLDALREATRQEPRATPGKISSANTMPYIIDCVRAYATVGEICRALRDVLGSYEETHFA